MNEKKDFDKVEWIVLLMAIVGSIYLLSLIGSSLKGLVFSPNTLVSDFCPDANFSMSPYTTPLCNGEGFTCSNEEERCWYDETQN